MKSQKSKPKAVPSQSEAHYWHHCIHTTVLTALRSHQCRHHCAHTAALTECCIHATAARARLSWTAKRKLSRWLWTRPFCIHTHQSLSTTSMSLRKLYGAESEKDFHCFACTKRLWISSTRMSADSAPLPLRSLPSSDKTGQSSLARERVSICLNATWAPSSILGLCDSFSLQPFKYHIMIIMNSIQWFLKTLTKTFKKKCVINQITDCTKNKTEHVLFLLKTSLWVFTPSGITQRYFRHSPAANKSNKAPTPNSKVSEPTSRGTNQDPWWCGGRIHCDVPKWLSVKILQKGYKIVHPSQAGDPFIHAYSNSHSH